MSNFSTIGGATIWIAVVFALMLAAIEPVSVTSSADYHASGASRMDMGVPSPG